MGNLNRGIIQGRGGATYPLYDDRVELECLPKDSKIFFMGRSVGKEVPTKPPLKTIGIYLHWVDGIGECSKGFDNVTEFAEFLKLNPVLGEAVGYVVKKKSG